MKKTIEKDKDISKINFNTFGFHKGNILLDESILRLSQDPNKILFIK